MNSIILLGIIHFVAGIICTVLIQEIMQIRRDIKNIQNKKTRL